MQLPLSTNQKVFKMMVMNAVRDIPSQRETVLIKLQNECKSLEMKNVAKKNRANAYRKYKHSSNERTVREPKYTNTQGD